MCWLVNVITILLLSEQKVNVHFTLRETLQTKKGHPKAALLNDLCVIYLFNFDLTAHGFFIFFDGYCQNTIIHYRINALTVDVSWQCE